MCCRTSKFPSHEWINAMKQIFVIAGLVLAVGFGSHAATPPPDFSGKWTCAHGQDQIPGALTQRGTQVQGYCMYPNGKRALFQGTIKDNTLYGTLQVDPRTQRTITATISVDTMRGNWSARGGGGGSWTAKRSDSR
jgi:hypothetical protein